MDIFEDKSFKLNYITSPGSVSQIQIAIFFFKSRTKIPPCQKKGKRKKNQSPNPQFPSSMDIFEYKSFKLKNFFILTEEYEEDKVVDGNSPPPLFSDDEAILCDPCFNKKCPEKHYLLLDALKSHILALYPGRRMSCGCGNQFTDNRQKTQHQA
ncbi:uncharacterized protein A4U43_C03F16600 [Asparagus officinalis]|uniref:Uncharacterized protein n=1 Tax=Asparagus officinalis TaxID=4686 RepID=A0A5P1FBJ3_ASPOF|nr:uncharacterized protein A4U43_C03F16600 [Asparagus officinalis]